MRYNEKLNFEKRFDPKTATPAQKVFKFFYRCQINKIHTVSKEQLKQFGSITTGDKAVDEAMANEMVYANYSPADMAEFYDRGIAFYIDDRSKTRQIYFDIVELLREWERVAADPLHVEEVPLESLEKLERFAGAVYTAARPGMMKDGMATSLANRLSRFGNSRLRHMNNRPELNIAIQQAKVEHTMTLTDSIRKHLIDKD